MTCSGSDLDTCASTGGNHTSTPKSCICIQFQTIMGRTQSYLWIFIIICIQHCLIHGQALSRKPRGSTLLEPKVKNSEHAEHHYGERKCPGTCMSPSACVNANGRNKGPCINGNVCCQFDMTCGETTSQLLSYFHSPHFPKHLNYSLPCSLTIKPMSHHITALRIDFEVFDMAPQTPHGGCTLDNLFVLNARDGPHEGICAMANYSSVLYFKGSENMTFHFVVQSTDWRWRLKLSQLNSSRTPPWKNSLECGRQLVYDQVGSDPSSSDNKIPQRPLIVNGERAGGSEFPWQVSIQVPPTHRCGGSILNNRFILSAAHCFTDAAYLGNLDMLRVVVGGEDLNSTELTSYEVHSVIVNQMYKPHESHINDIALLQLSEDIVFSTHVQPVCLPIPGIPIKNKNAIVSGWGRLNGSRYNSPKPYHLQKLEVRILEQKECQEIEQKEMLRLTANRSSEFKLAPTQICAQAAPNSTVCFGDSGGPLVVQNLEDGKFTQVGVVSFGLGPCLVQPSSPVVYTRVSSFLDFIALVVNSSEG